MPSRIKALEKTFAARIRQGTRRGYALRVKYSLRHPPSGLTLTHQLLWPLIFAQLVALKLWVRRRYGAGVPYWFHVSRWGRVSLRHMPGDFTASDTAPCALRPVPAVVRLFARSVRLALATAPEVRALVPPAPAADAWSVHVLSGAVQFDTS